VLAGAAVIAVIAGGALLIGGGGDSTSTSTPTSTTTPEEDLATFLPEKFRDSCEPEAKKDFEVGAKVGIQCDGPPGFTVYVESFDSQRDVSAAFKRYAANLETGSCGANNWSTKGTWYRTDPQKIVGRLACYTDSDGYNWILWTDDKQLKVAYLATEAFALDVRRAGFDPRAAGVEPVVEASATRLGLAADLDGDGMVDGASEERTTIACDVPGGRLSRIVGAQSLPLANGVVACVLSYADATGAGLAVPPGGLDATARSRVRRATLDVAITPPGAATPTVARVSTALRVAP